MHIGIIGLGDMGKLYARTFAAAGLQVLGTDRPSQLAELSNELGVYGIEVLSDGHEVARKADFLFFCVEAEKIGEVVAAYAKSIKFGAIVAGQTSVKTPEILAFDKYLPADVHVVTCHSLHGPGFSTVGQTLIIIRHKATDNAYQAALNVYRVLRSNIIKLKDYKQHDKIVADTQAITHMGFESMGSAWKNAGFFPWENPAYAGGIDNVKILTTLRIFSYKSHIYAGLAILNPYARKQVKAYAKAESELFKLMICEDKETFTSKIYAAKAAIFHDEHKFLLLDDDIMKEFSLSSQQHHFKPNSHLSILSMVYAWHQMNINPYEHLICQTPPFKLRLGIAEYLFRNEEMLKKAIETALYDKSIRADDLEFHTAVHEWASIIGYGDINGYKAHFEEAKTFFESRLTNGLKLSTQLITRLNNEVNA